MRTTVAVARKEHRCEGCGKAILKGDLFTMREYTGGGSNRSYPTCLECDGRKLTKDKAEARGN